MELWELFAFHWKLLNEIKFQIKTAMFCIHLVFDKLKSISVNENTGPKYNSFHYQSFINIKVELQCKTEACV